VLEGENAVARNREVMGATNPEQADQGTIRKTLAESIEANSVHGSDSPENAAIEIAYFFVISLHRYPDASDLVANFIFLAVGFAASLNCLRVPTNRHRVDGVIAALLHGGVLAMLTLLFMIGTLNRRSIEAVDGQIAAAAAILLLLALGAWRATRLIRLSAQLQESLATCCPYCEYDIRVLTTDRRCPECGAEAAIGSAD